MSNGTKDLVICAESCLCVNNTLQNKCVQAYENMTGDHADLLRQEFEQMDREFHTPSSQ